MARKPRLHVPGALYHVMLHSNGGQSIFFADDDWEHFEALVAEGVGRFGHRIHGYCWMSNHVHLAVQVAEVPLSRIMQNLAFRYTRWVNKRQGRVGHLFQGRYKAILVEAESYLLELVRYIHLNPVRARLVEEPAAYRWSGHRTYIGQAPVSWLTTDWVLSHLAGTERVARRRYAAFIAAGQGEGYRTDALIPIRWGWSDYLERKANRLKVRRLDDYNGLKPVPNQYKPGPIERMLILNVGQQQLLCSL